VLHLVHTDEGTGPARWYQHVRYPGMPLIAARKLQIGSRVCSLRIGIGTLWVATNVLTRFDPNLGGFTNSYGLLLLMPGPVLS